MTKNEKLRHCTGCRDNFYNGNNDLGVQECWMLEKAEMVSRKEVPMNQRPPWTQKPRRVLNCYNRSGYVYVDPRRTH